MQKAASPELCFGMLAREPLCLSTQSVIFMRLKMLCGDVGLFVVVSWCLACLRGFVDLLCFLGLGLLRPVLRLGCLCSLVSIRFWLVCLLDSCMVLTSPFHPLPPSTPPVNLYSMLGVFISCETVFAICVTVILSLEPMLKLSVFWVLLEKVSVRWMIALVQSVMYM